MDLKLIVLAGAKEGTQIPLKKDKFIIGRASECTLRAGSSAISRRHCAIVRKDDKWLVRDLGSRNGTFLNDTAVAEPTALKVGDEIRVGPLHFRVAEMAKAEGSGVKSAKPAPAAQAAASAPSPPPPSDVEIGSADVKRGKQPPVKGISDVAERAAKQVNGSASEDDISSWLLGLDGSSETSLRETQTLSLEETTAITRGKGIPEVTTEKAEAAGETAAEGEAPGDSKAEASNNKSGVWGLFKFGGKGSAKKTPGKLPPRPAEATKDSREAAADILREMARRR